MINTKIFTHQQRQQHLQLIY